MRGKCKDCEYFETEHVASAPTECHRYPPKNFLQQMQVPDLVAGGVSLKERMISVWPVVLPEQSCGEFTLKREGEKMQAPNLAKLVS